MAQVYVLHAVFCPAPQLFCDAQALCRPGTLQPHQNAYGMDEQSFLQLPEQVQGALWFLPVWLVSSGLFAGCVWFGRAAARFTRKDNVKLPVCAFACILIGLAGVFLNMRSCPLPYNLQAALLVVPVYLIAWLMQQFFSNFRHYTVWYGCLISALLLHLTNTKLHIFIDLASMHIPGVLFYPISIIGIYFVLSLSDPVRAHQTAGKGSLPF